MSTPSSVEPTHATVLDPKVTKASEPSSASSAAPAVVSLAQMRSLQAESTISHHVAVATGTGFIPLPIFDVVATTGVQADMLRQLFKIYGQEISKETARNVVTVLLGASVPSLTARTVASGFKLIPGVGTALGFFTAPSLAGVSTYVVGKVVQEHLAGGGSALDLQLSKAKSKVALEMSKIRTKSGQAVDEVTARVGNAIAALRGKKFTSPSVEEHATVVT
jgi:uncharacterized protein (DUF697 family)